MSRVDKRGCDNVKCFKEVVSVSVTIYFLLGFFVWFFVGCLVFFLFLDCWLVV